MTGRRAIVTGGTGFIGRFLVEGLLADGWAVEVWGRHGPQRDLFSRPVAFRPFILEPDGLNARGLLGAELVVHAAFDHVPGRYRGGEGDDPEGFRRRNVEGSIALFEAARTSGIPRAVFLSSRAVYGTHAPGVVLDETTPCRPDTLYGEVKLVVEEALSQMAGPAFRVARLRVTGVYGPGRPNKWDTLLDDWRAGRMLPTRAGTEVHGDDLAQAVRLALSELDGGAQDLLLNVLDLMVDHADIVTLLNEVGCREVAAPPRADIGKINVMTTERLRALGWQPGGRALLRETLADMLGHKLS